MIGSDARIAWRETCFGGVIELRSGDNPIACFDLLFNDEPIVENLIVVSSDSAKLMMRARLHDSTAPGILIGDGRGEVESVSLTRLRSARLRRVALTNGKARCCVKKGTYGG